MSDKPAAAPASTEDDRHMEIVLGVSRTLRNGLLPTDAPAVAGYEIAAGTSTDEAGAGGTAWCAFELGDGRAGLAALQSQGDGALPAHRIGVASALFRALGPSHISLAPVLKRVNEILSNSTLGSKLDQPIVCGVLAVGDDSVEWAGAGQPPGGLIRRGGAFEELNALGPPLGMLGGFHYGSENLDLGTGDTVLVLSAGSKGLLRGAADVVASLHGKPVGEVVSSLHRAIQRSSENSVDEVTALLLRKH